MNEKIFWIETILIIFVLAFEGIHAASKEDKSGILRVENFETRCFIKIINFPSTAIQEAPAT